MAIRGSLYHFLAQDSYRFYEWPVYQMFENGTTTKLAGKPYNPFDYEYKFHTKSFVYYKRT